MRRHDITREPLPAAGFDLVHTRALLVHLADRDAALNNMVQALKPGGWLLVEEPDYVSMVLDPRLSMERFAKGDAAIRTLMTAAGFDFSYGRRLFGDVRAAGLVDVDAEGQVGMIRPGEPVHQFNLLTFAQWRGRLIEAGLLSDAEFNAYIAAFSSPDFLMMSPIWMAVWGRKPG